MTTNNLKTAFVTGGTGFVGWNLCEQLLKEKWRVFALHRENSDLRYLNRLDVVPVEGDILERETLLSVIPKNVDAIFHVAGDINTWSKRNAAQTAINVDGTRNMVEAATEKQAGHFVFTSAIASYGIQDVPISETTPSTASYSSINYIRDKWQAEEIVRGAAASGDLSSSIIVPCGVMGPVDRFGWAAMIYMLRDGKLKGIPSGHLPIAHVREVTKAHIAAAYHGRNAETYILGGEQVTYDKLFRLIAKSIDIELNAKVMSAKMLAVVGKLQALVSMFTGKQPDLTPEMSSILSSQVTVVDEKAKSELGFRHTPVQECVDECVGWLRAEKLL